jgi:hypothetical protein
VQELIDPAPPAAARGGLLRRLLPPDSSRARRAVVRLVAAFSIAIGFAVIIGLVVAALANSVGGKTSAAKTPPPALTVPSGPVPPSQADVPGDWVAETSAAGIGFRAPPGWTRSSDAIVEFRVQPTPSGSAGVERIGVGVSSEGDPQTAATSYAQNTYAGQPGFIAQPATAEVSARGEPGQQVTVGYSRQGTLVEVVIRAFPTSRGVLIITSRAAGTDPQPAVDLADQLDASIRLP